MEGKKVKTQGCCQHSCNSSEAIVEKEARSLCSDELHYYVKCVNCRHVYFYSPFRQVEDSNES